jgi:ubiquinone/menaquinone biosynthesis C-methylase UbiE
MGNLVNRLAHFLTQILFSIITPPLLIPKIGKLSVTRFFISFCFGRLYGNRYQSVINAFQGRYGLAMAEGLSKAREIAGDTISMAVDCGTGTGFVTKQAADYFPRATFIAFDILPGMLTQARNNCKDIPTDVFYVQADTFALPLADQSVDLVLLQNTIPCFEEFARICRPGSIIIYVDTSAGWITSLAQQLVEKNRLFEKVISKRVDLGFYILAQKANNGKEFLKHSIDGETKQQKLINFLRCPLDKSSLKSDQGHLLCQHGHQYHFRNGFPVMLVKKNHVQS